MDLLSPLSVQGHVIELERTDPRHLSGSVVAGRAAGVPATVGPESGFGKLFFDALNNVNDLQHTTMDLTETMLTDRRGQPGPFDDQGDHGQGDSGVSRGDQHAMKRVEKENRASSR